MIVRSTKLSNETVCLEVWAYAMGQRIMMDSMVPKNARTIAAIWNNTLSTLYNRSHPSNYNFQYSTVSNVAVTVNAGDGPGGYVGYAQLPDAPEAQVHAEIHEPRFAGHVDVVLEEPVNDIPEPIVIPLPEDIPGLGEAGE